MGYFLRRSSLRHDRNFYNFRASKYVDRRFRIAQRSSTSGLWGWSVGALSSQCLLGKKSSDRISPAENKQGIKNTPTGNKTSCKKKKVPDKTFHNLRVWKSMSIDEFYVRVMSIDGCSCIKIVKRSVGLPYYNWIPLFSGRALFYFI